MILIDENLNEGYHTSHLLVLKKAEGAKQFEKARVELYVFSELNFSPSKLQAIFDMLDTV